MENIQTILFRITTSVATTLFIYNFILLILTGRGNRSRKILAFTNLAWGLLYLTLSTCDYLNIEFSSYPIFSIKTLVLSNFFICVMYLYPLENVYTKPLNVKNIFLLFSPSLLISLCYFSILYLTGEEIEDITSFPAFKESLGHFNVWYRFIIVACNLAYSFWLLRIIHAAIKGHEHEKDRESKEKMAWMNYYFNMMIVLVVFYLVTIFWGSQWNVIIYTAVIIGCFSILFYKGAFYSSNTQDNMIVTEEIAEQEEKEEEEEYQEHTEDLKDEYSEDINQEAEEIPSESLENIKNYSFENKIPTYVREIKQWMEKDQPYLNKNFQLTDVSTILPLNRSYLSRIFNEGFGKNFSEVVRSYRINYAKECITNQPQLQLHKIADTCGFTSYATFIRAFQKETGMSPKQFKLLL